MTAAFMPFGTEYRNGVSLATGWLNGSIGGAERIIVGQLTGPGAVKIYSSGSLLQGRPRDLSAERGAQPHRHLHRGWRASPRSMAGPAFASPRPAPRPVPTCLVSGVSGQDKTAQVLKYQLVRPDARARPCCNPSKISEVVSASGSLPNVLGGD